LSSDIDEVQLALQIRHILQAPKLRLVVRDGGSGDGGGGGGGSGNPGVSMNDKDEYNLNDRSTKRSFDQFNQDKLALEQDSNKRRGGSGKPFYILFDATFIDCFTIDLSDHSTSSNDGGPESWRFGPSFTTHRIVFETCGYILPFSACNRPETL
jgi:hypothetical protein